MTTRYAVLLLVQAGCAGADHLVVPPPPPPNPPPVPQVVRLEVSAVTPTVLAGGLSFLVASPLDRDGRIVPGQTVTWVSRAPDIAAIVPGGILRGLGLGHAVIVATLGSLQDSVSVEVLPASLRLEPGQSTAVYHGDALPLRASWHAVDGTLLANGPAVSWTSDAPGVVQVVPGTGTTATALATAPGRAVLSAGAGAHVTSVALDVFALPADGSRPPLFVKAFSVTEYTNDWYYDEPEFPSLYAAFIEIAIPEQHLEVEVLKVRVQIAGVSLVPVCGALRLPSGTVRDLFLTSSPDYQVVWEGESLFSADRKATATITYRVNGGPLEQVVAQGTVGFNYLTNVYQTFRGGWAACAE